MKKYAIVWMLMPPEVGFVAALGAEEPIHLPVFLAEENLALFERGEGAYFSPVTLLCGILLGSSTDPPGVDLEDTERYYPKALSLIAPELGMLNVGELILEAGGTIRREFGCAISARFLKNGMKFAPDSSKIRSDYIVDLWVAASDQDDPDYVAVFRKIVPILKTLDYGQLPSDIRKFISYIAAFVLSELEPEGVERYLDNNFSSADLEWDEDQKSHYSNYKASGRFLWPTIDPVDGAGKTPYRGKEPVEPAVNHVLFGEQTLRS
ncbi:hypothetical protein ACFL17_08195 [Pseudomonadota bacterium]